VSCYCSGSATGDACRPLASGACLPLPASPLPSVTYTLLLGCPLLASTTGHCNLTKQHTRLCHTPTCRTCRLPFSLAAPGSTPPSYPTLPSPHAVTAPLRLALLAPACCLWFTASHLRCRTLSQQQHAWVERLLLASCLRNTLPT